MLRGDDDGAKGVSQARWRPTTALCVTRNRASPQVKRIQRELEIDPTLPMLDAVHAAEAMLHWDFTQLDAAPLRVRT